MAILDELLVTLGFEYDPKEMKQFNEDVGKTVNTIKQLAKVAVAAAGAITTLTVASTRASDEQGKLADEIGDSVENIDALQFALERSGGSADGMTNSLRQLAIRASEASRGIGSGVEAFGILGISSTDLQGKLKPVSELMSEIAGELDGLDKAKQIELADKLGIRDSIRLLQQGRGSIAELTAEARALGVTTDEDAAIAADFQDSLTNLWKIVKQLSRVLSKSFAPVLESVVEGFTEWWKVNRQIIEQNLPIWIDRLAAAFKLLSLFVAVFLALKLVTHIAALVTIMKAATIGALAMNAAVAALPVLIAAGVTALLLLLEDAKVFFEGGDSFIGDMIKKFPQWTTEITAAAAVLATVADLTTRIFDGWSAIFDLFSKLSFENVGEVLSNLPGFTASLFGGDANTLPNLGDSISNSANTAIDKLEIIVQGGADTAENIGIAVLKTFEQATQDLQTAVDQ